MGNSSSQTLKEYITTNVSYSQTVSTALNLQNEAATSSTNINTVNIQNGGANCCLLTDKDGNPIVDAEGNPQTVPGCSMQKYPAKMDCSIDISQNTYSNIEVIQSISSEFAQQLSTQLQNTAQADVSNALELLQQNDLFSGFGDSTKQEVETNVTNNINTTLNSKTVLNIVNSAVTNSKNANNTILYNCGIMSGAACNITQNASSEILVQNVLNSIADLAQNNTELNDFYTTVNNNLTSTQEGVVGTMAGVFDKMFSALGNLALVFIIGGAVVVFIIILLAVYLLFFRKGRKAPVPSFTYGTPASSYETPASSYGPVPGVRR